MEEYAHSIALEFSSGSEAPGGVVRLAGLALASVEDLEWTVFIQVWYDNSLWSVLIQVWYDNFSFPDYCEDTMRNERINFLK